jgi:uncharacterized OB-fold protein
MSGKAKSTDTTKNSDKAPKAAPAKSRAKASKAVPAPSPAPVKSRAKATKATPAKSDTKATKAMPAKSDTKATKVTAPTKAIPTKSDTQAKVTPVKSPSTERGTVKVVANKYRLEGNFHLIHPNTPIYNEAQELMGVTNPRDITHIHMYGGESLFFSSLKDGKILGTRCDNPDCEFTGSVSLPFKIHCPDCLSRNTVVNLTDVARQTGKIHTFMVTERTGAFNTLPIPIKFINVEFNGVATILMSYLCVGSPKIGQRVVPVFRKKNPTYTILDLAWVPEGTKASKLPPEFSF